MENILKEFKIVFGLEDKPLQEGIKRTESSLKSLADSFAKIATTYLSYKTFSGIINGFNDFNIALENSTKIYGYNIQMVATYGNALKRFGGDTNSVVGALNSLNSQLQEAKFGGGALIELSKRYGISFTNANGSLMKAETLLSSLSQQLQKYDKQTRATIASQLGLDEAMQRAFIDGGRELNYLINQQKELGLVTEQDLKMSSAWNKTMLDFKDTITYLSRMLARTFLPILTNIVKGVTGFVEFLKRHQEFVRIFFVGMLLALTPVLLSLTKMALISGKVFAPFIKTATIIAGIALVVEDIYGYFKGWDTITGDLVKKFPALKNALEFIRPLVMGIEKAFQSTMAWLRDPSWSKFIQIFVDIGNAVIDTFKKPLEFIYTTIKNIVEVIEGYIGGFLDKAQNVVGGFLSKIPFIGGNSSTNTTNNNNTYNINQNFNGVNDKNVAPVVRNELDALINQNLQSK